MKLTLKREYLKDTYTIGKLYIDGEYFSDTLENKVRILNSYEDKVYGETAIPYGVYKVRLSYSNRFKKVLPELLNVNFFEGIRIHSGNYPIKDTQGCILVGENKQKGMILNSRATFNRLMDIIKDEEDITIEIL